MRNKATDPAFARLRALVLADCDLLNELAGLTDEEPFVTRLVELAASHGIATSEHAIRLTIRPDPLGLSRFAPVEPTQSRWPPPGFLPVMAGGQGSGFVIDWAWFGPEPLTEPFFEGAIRAALRRPFNRMFRWRMSLADFLAGAAQQAESRLTPDGFIFHMSRCGSTLVSQMLAQSDCNIAISEASPIDAAVRTNSPEILRAMVKAFGRPRSGHERRFFIKLDSWHALALPLFERTFPDTPWLFLYRDPLEVMVSQAREPGSQMVPQLVAPSIYGIDGPNIPGPDYTARVLNRICAAAADALASPRGRAINYRNLPDAFETDILPHFCVAPGATERAAMRGACRFDAKTPSMTFAADSAAKQAAASENLRALAGRHLVDIVGRLDAIAAEHADRRATTLL
jgi:hypothetical protein